MPRPRAEIMRDLKAILAELDYVMHGEEATPDSDVSPRLKQALDTAAAIQTHDDIRAKARAFKEVQSHEETGPLDIRGDELNRPERKERLKDYRPAHDPDWDEAVFLGSGDSKVD